MAVRYESAVTTPAHIKATQSFLSNISLDTSHRSKSIYRRSITERPIDQDPDFPWDCNNPKLNRFSSYPLEVTNRQIRFTKDIKVEECSSRFLFVSRNTAIVSVFSVLPYHSQDTVNKRKTLQIGRENSGHFTQTISYAYLLEDGETPVDTYDPYCLENPERSTNNYKTDIVLPGIIVSFLEFETPESFKKDENDQFKEKWPEVDITLSKMKSIKRDLLKVATLRHLPVTVLCYAFVYFETLAFSKYINKGNRKLAAGACLMLARKFLYSNLTVLSELAEVLRVSESDIVSEEFKVLAALKFSLHYPESAIIPHYSRLLGLGHQFAR